MMISSSAEFHELPDFPDFPVIIEQLEKLEKQKKKEDFRQIQIQIEDPFEDRRITYDKQNIDDHQKEKNSDDPIVIDIF